MLLTKDMKTSGPQMSRTRPVSSKNPRPIFTSSFCLSPSTRGEFCMETLACVTMLVACGDGRTGRRDKAAA